MMRRRRVRTRPTGRRRWAACALTTLVLLLVAVGLAYLSAGAVIEGATRRSLAEVVDQARQRGISLEGARFGSARFIPPFTVEWTGLFVTARRLPDGASATDRELGRADAFDVSARSARLRLLDWTEGRVLLTAEDLTVRLVPVAASANASFEELQAVSFDIDSARMPWQVDRHAPRAALERLAATAASLLESGTAHGELEFVGKGHFPFKGEVRGVVLETRREEAGTSVVLRRDDLRALEALFDGELTEAEIDVIAENPARAPRLLRIKDMAEQTAQRAQARDASVPEDAYRHCLWSFELTRAFGPELAQQVTDAHEIGAKRQTPADQKMDENNNALGRRWAMDGRREDEILSLVKTHPAVIKSPT